MIIFFVQAACVPKGHNITVLLAEYFNQSVSQAKMDEKRGS